MCQRGVDGPSVPARRGVLTDVVVMNGWDRDRVVAKVFISWRPGDPGDRTDGNNDGGVAQLVRAWAS